ncbi:MAG: transporter substrate-binding domain-containing protein [Anaerolineae bacterium]|nr:transporter substrate-binding domain-containing protein [Anaerolineae bacterium]
MVKIRQCAFIFALCALVSMVGCGESGAETAVTDSPPTAAIETDTSAATAEETAVMVESTRDPNYIIIATDAPTPPFADFDEFGNVIGFNDSIMSNLAAESGFAYEFVVTPYEGVLTSLAHGSREFDAVMPPIPVPDEQTEGIVYTTPYLEVGQVLLVLADQEEITSHLSLSPDTTVGVVGNSSGEVTARTDLNIPDSSLFSYDNATEAVQALVNGEVTAVILDNYTGSYFADTYPEQLKLASGADRTSWISQKAYAIAVAADNTDLLNRLNQAIAAMQTNNGVERTAALLIDDESERPLDPGEPRTGTSAEELVIGMVGQLTNLDPAMPPDLINWELKMNTMSGLYMVDSDNHLVPLLAADMPQVSADGLEYTIPLRANLKFPDGTDFTADDVVWSINRAKFGQGGYLVNRFLKDADEDGYGDADAVQAISDSTVIIRLQEPTAYFPQVLATPPFFAISSDCFANTEDLTSTCGGIGPYTIITWEPDAIRLQANPDWPGSTPPAFENIKVRFYSSVADLRTSLEEFGAVDVAWTGLPYADFVALQNSGDLYQSWSGPAAFKSYVIFEQSQPPWDKRSLREAAALSLNREALAEIVFEGERLPLYSPVPDEVPGHIPALPQRDLSRAQFLLQSEGYTAQQPLEITLWYLNDGRYSLKEEAYATAIKEQLEETGAIKVTLEGAPWDIYRGQISECNYPAYLLGWPSVGQPVNYLDMTAWTDFFLENSDDVFCSNYESTRMDQLVAQARAEQDPVKRQALNAQIQELWATDLPTLDITQAPRFAISTASVDNVKIDALGMLHYETLTKTKE